MEGTLRALDDGERERLGRRIRDVVDGIARTNGAQGSVAFRDDGLPALTNEGALARRARRSLEETLGAGAVVDIEAQMGAEDFALFARRVPAFYWKLGVRNRERGVVGMTHSEGFDVDESAIGVGVRGMLALVLGELAVASR